MSDLDTLDEALQAAVALPPSRPLARDRFALEGQHAAASLIVGDLLASNQFVTSQPILLSEARTQ